MRFRAIIAGFVFALIWSSAFTAAKLTIADSAPIFILAVRFLIGGLLGVTLALVIGQKIDFSYSEWKSIIVFGFFQNTVYLGLNYTAMQWIDASVAAIIASLLPIAIAAIYWGYFRQKLNMIGLAGLFLGFCGVLIIMSTRYSGNYNSLGMLLCILALMALAAATITVQKHIKKNILMVVGLQMLIGSVTLYPISIIFEDFYFNFTLPLTLSFIYIVVAPGLVATIIWFWLISEVGATKASSFHFLNPFFGILFASLILAENISLFDIIGVLVISTGILCVQASKTSLKNLN